MPTRAINCARIEQPVADSAAPSIESEGSSAYRSSAKPAEAASVMPMRAINCTHTEQRVAVSAAPSEGSSAYQS